MTGSCTECREYHSAAFYQPQIVLERVEGSRRHDVAIISEETGDLRAAIELIVSHSPEQAVIDACKATNIPLFSFDIRREEDIQNILTGNAIMVYRAPNCPTLKCPECGYPMEMQQIFMGREKPQMRIGEAWIDYRTWTEHEREIGRQVWRTRKKQWLGYSCACSRSATWYG